ncbi:isopenicillin N synthase family dioxygenase [Sphingobium subterraneum]|uniref:2-oxoglutarate-dependent ethylene/succinate-forming enzyme n=1 Tax=Sphingobium subterraneum TaxID=627688 RepID=A0A841J1L1_9SPHN|nr:isopenicillin N synthase family oxygenase [Sphingobium subterraneum]MBB6122428.1 isopenicillin N synthase-like dioxygenase [Sphingobium subterraneum]
MASSHVPLLSLRDPDSPAFVDALGASFRRFGFAMIGDHGIDPALIAQGWALSRAFFALPDDVKQRYIVQGGAGQRGYTPFATEIAKGAQAHDLKEFWHIGRDLDPASPLASSMPPNIWPRECEGFRTCFTSLFAAFDRAGANILRAIARHLGLAPDWFEDPIRNGNSILRLLHYPPLDGASNGMRAGAHEDINLITLLLGAEEAGLQLRERNGDWLAIDPPLGALVVNIGDMLQRLTNHVLPSTTHRVVNPPAERSGISRYSMPFFLHLRPDFVIEPLAQCVDTAHPPRDPAIRAQDYLHERLREIGLVAHEGAA